MKELTIETPIGSYPVQIGRGILKELVHAIDKTSPVLIVTDENVAKFHLDTLIEVLKDYKTFIFTLGPTPEKDKQLTTYAKLVTFVLDAKLSRKTTVLAFGGGAVGDFAGYFAATYMRGVPFIQVPTTLLAHDSSVGGKVALNHGGVKNIIGTFYQPKAVIYELSFLDTLPLEEKRSGLGELIKHDLLSDGSFLNKLIHYNEIEDVFKDEVRFEEELTRAIEIKYSYLKDDVYDQGGKRKYLNLGHTLGHGMEAHYGIPHGEAILFGLCFSLYLTQEEIGIEFYHHFLRLGFFRFMKDGFNMNIDDLLNAMDHDKKNVDEKLHFISLDQIGKPNSIFLTHEAFTSTFHQFITRLEC